MAYLVALTALLGSALAAPANTTLVSDKRQTSSTSFIQFGSHCAQDVYYEVFSNTSPQVTGGLLTSGRLIQGAPGQQSAEVNYGEQGVGISIKASFNPSPSESGPVLQFEVGKDTGNNLINYDISAVNGDPFLAQGSSMYVDQNPGSPCDVITCPPDDDSCAFQFPEDNTKDHGCGGVQHVVFAQVCG